MVILGKYATVILKNILVCEKLALLYIVTNKLSSLSNALLIQGLLFITLLLKNMKTSVFLQKTRNVNDVCFFLKRNGAVFLVSRMCFLHLT